MLKHKFLSIKMKPIIYWKPLTFIPFQLHVRILLSERCYPHSLPNPVAKYIKNFREQTSQLYVFSPPPSPGVKTLFNYPLLLIVFILTPPPPRKNTHTHFFLSLDTTLSFFGHKIWPSFHYIHHHSIPSPLLSVFLIPWQGVCLFSS